MRYNDFMLFLGSIAEKFFIQVLFCVSIQVYNNFYSHFYANDDTGNNIRLNNKTLSMPW